MGAGGQLRGSGGAFEADAIGDEAELRGGVAGVAGMKEKENGLNDGSQLRGR